MTSASLQLPAPLRAQLDEIRAQLHGGSKNAVLPVIGSGLSRGLLSWTKLLEQLIAEVRETERAGLSEELAQGKYLEVAGDLEALLHRGRVSAAIARAYQRPSAAAPPIYEVVASLPVTHFLTTNFDPWLKDAVGVRLKQMPRVYAPHDAGALSDLGPGSPPLVLMLHGDADRAETCVLSEAGYRKLSHYPAYRQALAGLVGQRSLLFVGHSLADPDLRLVLDEWQEVFGGGGVPRHWFLGVGISERVKRRLLDRGVMPVEYGKEGDFSLLEPALRYLAVPPGGGGASGMAGGAGTASGTSGDAAGSGSGKEASPAPVDVTTYLRRVENETQWADLLGITRGVDALQVRLDHVFIPLRAHVSSRRPGAAPSALSAHVAPRSVVDAARTHTFLAVIGDPGSGKTTLLQYVAHHLARAVRGDAGARATLSIPEGAEVALPLFVPLRHVAAFLVDRGDHPLARDLEDAIVKWAAEDRRGLPGPWLREAIAGRRVALLLDGLDEIPDKAHRRRAVLAIRCAAEGLAARDGGPGSITVTSRPAAYGGAVRLEGPFEEARLLDLDRGEVESFLGRWVRAVDAVPEADPLDLHPQAERKLEGMLGAVRASATMDALSRKPVLLTAIALVYQYRGRLPEQRALLYEEAIAVLLRRFEHHPTWRPAVVRRHLAAVAWHLMEASDPDRLREDEHEGGVKELIARRLAGLSEGAPALEISREAKDQAEGLLEAQALLAGLLRIDEDRRCRFVHRTFQEYLAATWLADQREDVMQEVMKRRLGEASWRETLRLTAGVLAAHQEGALGRLLKELVGGADRPLAERAQGVAGAAALLADVEQFDVDPSVLGPIRVQRDALMGVLENRGSPEDLRLGIGEALGRVGDPRLTEERRWVEVPAGPFWRGAAEGDELADDEEKPKSGHEVVLVSRFKVQRWPVTVEEFARFVDDKGYVEREHWEDEEGWAWRVREQVGAPDNWSRQRSGPWNVPVTGVSWWEASAYCRWWTGRLGRALEKGWEIRLPTEAEWEKAARGGFVLADGRANPAPQRKYAWEGEWDARKANVDSRIGRATPVGCFPGSHGPDGAWDQIGNVWEWCQDWFDPAAYQRAVREDPAVLDAAGVPDRLAYDPAKKESVRARCRVVRGGGWGSDSLFARVSYRYWFGPWSRGDALGFRCVAAPPRPRH